MRLAITFRALWAYKSTLSSRGDWPRRRSTTKVAPLPVWLSVFGATGMTAYFGLLDVGRPESGETVVVSGAAGAVGSVVGQIAKIKGCRAVGIAGGAEKCRYIVDDLGFDAAIDYKADDVETALRQHCPKGIDVYFDNVGGEILDTVLLQISRSARIVVCGAISQYNNTTPVQGPSNYLSLLVNRASMTGFVCFDYADRYGDAALRNGRLDGRRQAQVAGRRGGRIRDVSRNAAQALQGREHRQAHDEGRGRLTFGLSFYKPDSKLELYISKLYAPQPYDFWIRALKEKCTWDNH